MPSSISNSRGDTAILRAIALAAAIVITTLYALLIAVWAPDVRSGQDQGSDNAIAIEHFLYGKPPVAAIVGSSQAERFLADALGPDIANLALAGQNPLVGLSIIARSGHVPRRIYVEINQIGGPVDTALVDGFFAQPGYTLKRIVKALRTAYQPVNVLVSLVRRTVRGRDEIFYPQLDDPVLHDTLVAREQGLLDMPPDATLLDRNLADAKRLIAALAARGAETVFFEMPIEPQFEHAAGVVAVRQAVHAAFPPDQTCWNATGAPAGSPTTDGVHVDSDTAARFGSSLIQIVCHPPTVAAEPPQRH